MDADVEQLRIRVLELEQASARANRTTRVALIVGVLGVLSPLLSMSGLLNAKFRKVSAREVDVIDPSGKKRVDLIGDDNGGTIGVHGNDDATSLVLQTSITGATIYASDLGGHVSIQANRNPVLGGSIDVSSDEPSTIVSLDATNNTGANAVVQLTTKNGMSTFEIRDRGAADFHSQLSVGIGLGDGPSAKLGADTGDSQGGVAGLDVTSGGFPHYDANVSVQKNHAAYRLSGPKSDALFDAELSESMAPNLDIQGAGWFWHAQNQAEKPAK